MVASQLSVKPRTGQTPSQATISKLKKAMADPTRTLHGVSIAERQRAERDFANITSKGYYDPQDSFEAQNKKIQYQLSQPKNSNNFTNLKIQQIEGDIGRNNTDARNNFLRARVLELRQKEREAQADAHMQGVLARLQNGEIVAPAYFQNNITQAQLGVITSQQFLTVYQGFVTMGTIHKPIIVEKPIPVEIPSTPTPEPEPTPPAVTSSFPIIPIIIIAVIVGIFLLRRRA